MSIYFDTKTSISNENPKLMLYLVKKLNSRKNSLINMITYLQKINSKEEYFNQKNSTINFLENLLEDFQQSIFAIKALLTENKALCLSNEAKLNEIKKQIKENNILYTENEDLKKSQNNFSNDFYKNTNFISNTEENLRSKSSQNNFLDFENYNFKNSVRLNLKKKNYNSFSNSNDLIIKIINNAENLNLVNQKLGKNVIKKLIDPNCSKEYYSKVKKILNENEINNNLKVPIRMKNNIQAKINSQKSNNKKIKNKNSVLTNKKNSSQRNLKEFNKNVFDNYTN